MTFYSSTTTSSSNPFANTTTAVPVQTTFHRGSFTKRRCEDSMGESSCRHHVGHQKKKNERTKPQENQDIVFSTRVPYPITTILIPKIPPPPSLRSVLLLDPPTLRLAAKHKLQSDKELRLEGSLGI
ncbi:unnamed protein product [Cylindrotheca closterium]|uniref:Uncharacterized protein n=1 Tax=Cylindrotheca closterium TaxID=2856 RepID=A0AAD2G0U8_9STRA|nr:unnamed protein product [Cylindrotheca closterium]